MITHVRATRSINPATIRVTGLSAGGAMVAVVLPPPEVESGAIIAGLPMSRKPVAGAPYRNWATRPFHPAAGLLLRPRLTVSKA